MRLAWKLGLICCLAALPGSIAQSSQQMTILSQLPKCGLSCLMTALENSPCPPTNLTCACTNKDMNFEVTKCVLQSCNVRETLTTKNLTMTLCNQPVRNRSKDYIIMSNVLGIAGGAFILLRLVGNLCCNSRLGIDDWFVLLTGLSTIPSLVINQYGVAANGLGRDVWNVSFEEITNFGYYFWIMAILYFAQITMLKMVLLFFYLRIFLTKASRSLLWGTVLFNGIFGSVFVFLVVAQCQPISYFWTRWDGQHQGQCIDENTVSWTNAGISIALDVWMLSIPLFQIRNLNMNWKKKMDVGVMFFVGTFVTVVSIVRLQFLVKFGRSGNQTWDYLDVNRWSVIEIAIGEICVCMPSIRVALSRARSKIVDMRQKSRTRHGNGNLNSIENNGVEVMVMESRPVSRTDSMRSEVEPVGTGRQETIYVIYDESDEAELVHRNEV